jgi:tetratricopeptide (TPR) repeat protein
MAPVALHASPHWMDGVTAFYEGQRQMRSRHWDQALIAFDAASSAERIQPQVCFYRAAVLNRLGRHAEVLPLLNRALQGGYLNPDYLFEAGWAYLALRDPGRARRCLDQYLARHPLNSKAIEFRGRARILLGDIAGGRADLEEARRRDPALAPGVVLVLAMIQPETPAERRERELQDIIEQYPESPLGRILSGRWRPTVVLRRRGFRGTGGLSGGNNDNVVNLGSGIALPSDISNASSGFARGFSRLAYDLELGEKNLHDGGVQLPGLSVL